MTRTSASVDVISGTSAGGINGACLALSLANRKGGLDLLRDLWAEQGRMDNLLRAPFRGQPTSLLRGDEYFLPELTRALRSLTADFDPTPGYAVDLTITTTLLGGATLLTTDGLGQRLPQRRHGANFRFATSPLHKGPNDFDREHVAATAAAMGLAARCTAGFPFAFEPTFVPVQSPTRGQSAPARAVIGGRPNMWRWASWAEPTRAAAAYPDEAEDLSRYAVDGGVLANTPTREALDAIDRRGASGPMRRAMLLVFPHAPTYDPDADPPDRVGEPPTVAGAVGGLLGSLTSQGSLTFVEQIDEHNRRALGWRGGRERLLDLFDFADLRDLVDAGWDLYAATRMQAAARTLSTRVPRPDGWDFGRVVNASAEGQRLWRLRNGDTLPYVPRHPLLRRPDPRSTEPSTSETTPARTHDWGWGTTVALGVADAVAEMLFAAQSLVPVGPDAQRLDTALARVSNARDTMLEVRDQFDDWWWHHPALVQVAPDEDYWALRLDCYHRAMRDVGAPSWTDTWLEDAVAEAARPRRRDADRRPAAGRPGRAARARAEQPALGDRRREPRLADQHRGHERRRRPGRAGAAAPRPGADRQPRRPAAALARRPGRGGPPGEPDNPADRMLTRLLTLDAATWMLADAESAGTSQAVNLAQLSLVINHDLWATKSRTPDDKVAGSELNRFGGLPQAVVADQRLDLGPAGRGPDALPARPRPAAAAPGGRAERAHRRGRRRACSCSTRTASRRAPPSWPRAEQAAVEELGKLFSGELRDRGYLPHLAALAAYPIQQRIIVAELPELARAIEQDRVAGSNQRSRGVAFLEVERTLLDTLGEGGAGPVAHARSRGPGGLRPGRGRARAARGRGAQRRDDPDRGDGRRDPGDARRQRPRRPQGAQAADQGGPGRGPGAVLAGHRAALGLGHRPHARAARVRRRRGRARARAVRHPRGAVRGRDDHRRRGRRGRAGLRRAALRHAPARRGAGRRGRAPGGAGGPGHAPGAATTRSPPRVRSSRSAPWR